MSNDSSWRCCVDENTLDIIKNSLWKCTDVHPRAEPTEDWAWRKKYIGLVGKLTILESNRWPGDYRVIFTNDEQQGFVTTAVCIVLNGYKLTITTDRTVYIFEMRVHKPIALPKKLKSSFLD